MSSISGSPAAAEAPRRRNGRQQACEPCRLRKVACDHRLPVCSRCKRGRITGKCVYVSQPRTSLSLRNPEPAATTQCPSPLPSRPSPSASPVEWTPARAEGHIGYLGPTSFSAVFEESQVTLPWVCDPDVWVEDDGSANAGAAHRLDRTAWEEGIGLLRYIPSRQTAKALFDRHWSSSSGWCRLAAKRISDSFWSMYGSIIEQGDTEALGRLSQMLYRNSSIPLNENQSDGNEWIESFVGENLRWECIGLLFIYWAFGAVTLPEDASLREQREITKHDRRKLMQKYKQTAAKCTRLGYGDSHANTILLHCMYNNGILESTVSGDASREQWRLHGEVITTITFLGLHVSSPLEDELSATVQIKRRLFAAVFNIDKVVATFAGRPPLLNRRYQSVPLPLDINDHELLAPEATRRAHREQNLDENGWSKEDKLTPSSTLRARTILSTVRDQILEVALRDPGYSSGDILQDLKRQEDEAVSKIPRRIIYCDGEISDLTVGGRALYTKLLVRLEHLQNLFFIERLLYNGGHTTGADLLDVSLQMVSLTVLFWTHQNRLAEVENCLEWLVMSYAAPAGGILCVELLKGSSYDATNPMTTRSTIVQQLSLLASFLDWVHPTAPNGEFCISVKRVIRRALDEALNTNSPMADIMDGVASWDMNLTTDFNELFNFDLLDTFDWLRPDGASHLQ